MARARWQVGSLPPGPGAPSDPGLLDTDDRPLLRVQSLGAATVLVGDLRIDPSADTLFALLMRTVYAPGIQVGRDVLLRSLWAGQPESRQRANLRQALYKLRLLGVRIGLTGDVVALEAAQLAPVFAVERTSLRFDADVTRGHEPFGTFLPGYSTGCGEYDEWLSVQREAIHADVRRVLVEQLSVRRQRADWTAADALAKWLLQFDPLNEEATFTVAECLARNGSKIEAMAMIERYRDDLGPEASELRLSANLLRRRVSEAPRHGRTRASFAPTERHFVGRDDLMAELTLALRRTKWRDGSAMLLHAPPGMGKTRLTQEMAKVAAIEGFRVIATDCREGEQQRPLAVFLDLIPDLLEMPGAAACDPDSMRVLRRLVNERAGDAPPARSTESADAAKGDGIAEPERASALHREPLPLPSVLRRSIVDLVHNVCFEQPTLIVADNLHWVDELSAGVFADLAAASRDSKFCLLATSRTPTVLVLAPMLAAGADARMLQPLSNESARQLALAICADLDTDCDSDVHEWFIRASEGTPLFLRALVTHWIETGSAGGIPPTLATVLDQRLAALSDDALRTVQAAALLGRHATVQSVTALLEFSTIRMIGALDELASAGAYAPTDDPSIVFHELVARGAMRRLSVPSTRLLHSRAAAVLQGATPGVEVATAIDVVEHLREAGADAALLDFAVRSASEFLRIGLPHRALAVCEAARRSRATMDGWEELSRVEVTAMYAAGQHARVMQRLPQSSRDAMHTGSWDEQHSEVVIATVDSMRHEPIVDDYNQLAARAALLAESPMLHEDTRFRAACASIRAAYYSSERLAADRSFTAAMQLLPFISNPDRSRRELEMFYHTGFGEPSTARDAAIWLAKQAETYDSLSTRTLMLGSIAFGLRANGAPAAAYDLYRRVFAEASRAGMASAAAISAWNASLIALDHLDDLQEAENWLNRPECMSQAIVNQHASVVLQHNRVRVAIVRGDGEAAATSLALIPRNSIGLNVPGRAAYFRAVELGTARVLNDSIKLTELLPTSLDILSVTKRMIGQDFFVSEVALALIQLGRADAASSMMHEYLTVDRRHSLAIPAYLSRLSSELNIRS